MTSESEFTQVTSTVVLRDEDDFDPMRELFTAQGSHPPHLREINLRGLTPFQRALLVIDGTVTKFIEAYTMEPVAILRLSQERQILQTPHTWLEAPAHATVIARQVLLQGKYSYTCHAYAVSLIVPDRLPEPTRVYLEDDGGGLGRILVDNRIETYRDVLWYGREDTSHLPAVVRRRIGDECITRTYRIISEGQPVMLINERFPLNYDRLPLLH